MLFSSLIFICVFLPLVLGLYLLLPKALNNVVLVVASLVFYAWGDPIAALLLVLPSIAINFQLGRRIDAAAGARRRQILIAAVAFNLAILIVFKYAQFIVSNLNAVLGTVSTAVIPEPNIALPLGISFFTFHTISYLVDVYRGLFPAQSSLAAYTLYIVNFPQLIAGPIIRYRQMVGQLGERTVTFGDIEYGVLRFTAGLGKKLLLADPVGRIADAVFALPPGELSAGAAWLGVICYALQIYFDFSGYSDMAIGLARMFGFRFPENFNYPYAATSVQDFWRRWHMTLSAWFRDYVYIPLGGNRFGAWTTARNLWIVFFLAGAWHGASWQFIVWGLWHGLFLAIERLKPVERALAAGPTVLQAGYTLLVVLIGWVFFRSPSLSHALEFLRCMFGFNAHLAEPVATLDLLTPQTLVLLAACSCFTFPLWPLAKSLWWQPAVRRHVIAGDLGRAAFVVTVVVLSFAAMVSQQTVSFLYFRF